MTGRLVMKTDPARDVGLAYAAHAYEDDVHAPHCGTVGPDPWHSSSMDSGLDVSDARHRVAIIGSGFGGLFVAKCLKRAEVDITLISRVSHHTFQPLLYQVATGILSQANIAPATREILKRQKNAKVLLGEVSEIDLQCAHGHLGGGCASYGDRVRLTDPGGGRRDRRFRQRRVEPFAPGLKSIDDALELRARIFGAFEMAELETDPDAVAAWMTFVVVGAGPTGVELAGQIVELSRRTIKHDFRRIDPRDARVILVEGGDHVLSTFGPNQSVKAQRQLTKMGIDVRLQGLVDAVNETGVEVRFRDGHLEHIASRCVIWAAGVQASALGQQVAEQSTPRSIAPGA